MNFLKTLCTWTLNNENAVTKGVEGRSQHRLGRVWERWQQVGSGQESLCQDCEVSECELAGAAALPATPCTICGNYSFTWEQSNQDDGKLNPSISAIHAIGMEPVCASPNSLCLSLKCLEAVISGFIEYSSWHSDVTLILYFPSLFSIQGCVLLKLAWVTFLSPRRRIVKQTTCGRWEA